MEISGRQVMPDDLLSPLMQLSGHCWLPKPGTCSTKHALKLCPSRFHHLEAARSLLMKSILQKRSGQLLCSCCSNSSPCCWVVRSANCAANVQVGSSAGCVNTHCNV